MGKFTLTTQIEIYASAQRVWEILTDFAAYPEWNPFIQKISGKLQVSEKINVMVQPVNEQAMQFKPKILKLEAQKEFIWLGHVLIPGLFDGQHCFRIEALDADRVLLIQEEHFSGLLVSLLRKKLETGTYQGFEKMNQALKQRAEQK